MRALHLNSELIERIDAAECAFFGNLLDATNSVLGKNVGSLLQRPGIKAFIAPTVEDPLFNRVLLSSPCSVTDLAGILDDYRSKGMHPAIEISPGALEPALSLALYDLGYAQTEFLPVLVNRSENLIEAEPKLRVSQVGSAAELKLFKELLIEGWTIPPAEFPATLTSSVDKWIDLPGITLLLAYDGAEAITCGILHSVNNMAFLAVSATPPRFRGRGGQTAIDTGRINAGRKANAEFLWSRTYFASVSQKNKEKLGLNVLYTRALWTKLKR